MQKNRCLCLIFGLILWLSCQGAGGVVLKKGQGDDGPISLAKEVEVFRDPTGKVTMKDIVSEPQKYSFAHEDIRSLERYSNDALWIRVSLQHEESTPIDWVVQIFPGWIDEVEMYCVASDGKVSSNKIGDQLSFSEREIKSSIMAFPLVVDSTARVHYFRVKTHGPTILDLNLWQKSVFDRVELKRSLFFSAFAGSIGVMVLMNLIFWKWTRDANYLIYSLFLVVMLGAVFAVQGYASSLFFPENPVYADRFVDATTCALMSISAVFVCRFFNYKEYSPQTSRFTYLAAFIFLAATVLALCGVIENSIRWLLYLQIAVGAFNTLFIFWFIVRRKVFHQLFAALVFLVVNSSWLFYCVVLLGMVRLEQSFVTESLIQLTQLANLAVLNIAVVSRSRDSELKLRAERKRAFDSMKIAKIALEERVRQREFVAILSHEFRTPLAIVDAVAQALGLSPSGSDERVKRSVEKIRKATRRLTTLVENILLDDTLESGARPTVRNFDLWSVIENVRHIGLPDEQARLNVTAAGQPVMFEGDQEKIEMALRNLILNAIKYSPADSMVDVKCDASSNTFSVTVSNKGNPIPESEKSELFERYFRGGNSSLVPGSGLGLHISRAITRLHGGDVVLVSSDGAGTVFRLTLPLPPQ
ncbi:sensor histidine kinase [Variovorax sp. efr-133-TYG-130]|uniref:sensor histidine kinase n=1 Tax=Variovorax sp. efr-133-TYG-130 TaxID=3040327 RepID=UPI002553DBB8|nr:sensor histidine kinase [Variovorax sp. efr-133-TYG-130]